MTTLQILKSMDFTKTQKLDISRTKHFFSSNKNFINYTIKDYFIAKNSFVGEVTFKNTPSYSFKYFESSDAIVVKKKSLLKVSLFLCSNSCQKL